MLTHSPNTLHLKQQQHLSALFMTLPHCDLRQEMINSETTLVTWVRRLHSMIRCKEQMFLVPSIKVQPCSKEDFLKVLFNNFPWPVGFAHARELVPQTLHSGFAWGRWKQMSTCGKSNRDSGTLKPIRLLCFPESLLDKIKITNTSKLLRLKRKGC